MVAGVQEFYTRTRTVTWKFRGPSYNLADNAVTSLENFLTKLIFLASTNATVLTDSSTSILETMSKRKVGKSSLLILISYEQAFANIVKNFKEIVSKFSEFIGKLASTFNDVLIRLSCVLSNFMKRFLKCTTLQCKVELDYTRVIRQYQRLMNTLAIIAETLINKCDDAATHRAYQAVTILSIIFNYFTMTVQGINTCVQDIIFEESGTIAVNIRSLSESMQYVVIEITQAVSRISFPFTKTIKELLTHLVNMTMAFNTSVKGILGVFRGVAITAGEISQNFG